MYYKLVVPGEHAVFGASLTAFVAYEQRLLAAAGAVGMPTASPGR